jgi:Raf kinase inhibitor-like YbhB/YbcL family protein
MRNAYAVMGVGMLILGIAIYLGTRQAEAPTIPTPEPLMAFTLSSPAFENGKTIPSEFTCDGTNTSPELHIENTPRETVSLALIIDDPDIPQVVKERMGIDVFDHYVLYNIPADTQVIPAANATVGTVGKNTRSMGYTGPCPPPEYEPREHRYIFQLYALDTTLELPEGATAAELKAAMEGHIIETSFMIGRYERASSKTN